MFSLSGKKIKLVAQTEGPNSSIISSTRRSNANEIILQPFPFFGQSWQRNTPTRPPPLTSSWRDETFCIGLSSKGGLIRPHAPPPTCAEVFFWIFFFFLILLILCFVYLYLSSYNTFLSMKILENHIKL